ncbi:MAG: prepilin-type N-terminal cleavage/methylation domain-containing protein [Bacilli bacterium]|nr:prepilin-type N-terminal cleavage/methylation domain-containing protein [Bacilli bacterium]
MKNKGFTLVELLAVIVMIAIVASISVPIIISVINDSRAKSYDRQVEMIKDAAERYVNENALEFSENKVSVETLKSTGYLKADKIKNPKRPSEELNGCVNITSSGNKNTYTYSESC